jgi:hypothetical protein
MSAFLSAAMFRGIAVTASRYLPHSRTCYVPCLEDQHSCTIECMSAYLSAVVFRAIAVTAS